METMTIRLCLHVERTEVVDGGSDDDWITWWAESPDMAGFSAAAPTLHELRESIRETLSIELKSAQFELVETLVVPGHDSRDDAPQTMVLTSLTVA